MKYPAVLIFAILCLNPALSNVVQHPIGKCGIPAIKPDTSTNIVGGKFAIPYSWPWQVSLQRFGEIHKCGGTLLSNEWVMTAAHCVDGEKLGKLDEYYNIRLGVFNKTRTDEGGEQIAEILEIHIHPKYTFLNVTYDIALLKLTKPVQFTDHVSPICIPTIQDEELPSVGTNMFIIGWGNTKAPSSDDSEILKQAVVPRVSDQKCKTADPRHEEDYDEKVQFCVGFDNGYVGGCHGDSGGPAMIQTSDGSWKQMGIFSWIHSGRCASPSYSVYSKVPAFVDFIQKYVKI